MSNATSNAPRVVLKSAVLAALAAGSMFAASVHAAAPVLFGSDFVANSNGTTFTQQNGQWYGYSSAVPSGGTAAFTFSYTNLEGGQAAIAYASGVYLQEQTVRTPVTANDYWGVAVTAPGSNSAVVGMPLKGQTAIIVRGGNYTGTATTLTVVLGNGKNVGQQYLDPAQDTTATAICKANFTLVGIGGPSTTYPGGSLTGMNTYVVPVKNFKCSKGSVTTLDSTGVTVIGVQLNPTLSTNKAMGTLNDVEGIAIEYVGFTN